MNLRSELLNSYKRRRLNCVFEPRRKTYCPQHSQLVFRQNRCSGISNGANESSI